MAVSIAQYVDLLFKKLQGVAKTANSTVKSASNESIASPAFLRGDVVWMQSDQIPSTAQAVANITQARTNANSVQCTADNTVPPIGGVYPTWTTSVSYWVPQEFGSTWLPKVYVGPASAANIQATGTQIFADGIGGTGEYYFDTQAGVLNFIGETIPTVLTAGNVVYVSGYQYIGALGVTNIPSGANIGNLQISNTTITTTLANGNITLASTGTQLVQVAGTAGFVVPVGNTGQRPNPATTGTIRFNSTTVQTEIWDGSQWVSATGTVSAITNQTLTGDNSTVTFSLNYSATAESILVTINGVMQTPTTAYTTDTGALTITFTEAPAIADIIQIRYIAATTVLASLINGTSNVAIPVSGGNINLTAGGNTSFTVTSTGAVVSGNITTGNLSLTGNIISPNITGNATAGNLTAIGTISTSGNVVVGNINNANGNGIGNIGSSTTYFNMVFAQATSAQYADLAEMYVADNDYLPGTVLSFGGTAEVTETLIDSDPCVAGVVSTSPAYIMNSGLDTRYQVKLALTGRVPCRVVGPVTKGAMMVSARNGAARAEKYPAMGTIIGKALEDFTGKTGVIEVVVGRL
jgi:hypothetical protein